MARTKGMLNLSGNLEVNAQAPLDARTIVPTEADLTVASNFPYPYVGLEVYVTGTDKKFRLTNLDVTQSSSWHEIGEGGGGETYSDFTGATSSTAGAHGLVPAPSAGDEGKVLFGNGLWGALPSVDLSVLSNEAFILSATEKAVGMNTDRKLLYAKTIDFGTVTSGDQYLTVDVSSLNIDELVFFLGRINRSSEILSIPCWYTDNQNITWNGLSNNALSVKVKGYSNGDTVTMTAFYTKTTDSPLPAGVKFAGVTSSGEVRLMKEVTLGNLPNNSTKQVAHGITNIGRIWLGEAYGITASKISIPLPFMNVQGNQYNIQIYVDSTNVNIVTTSDNSGYSGYVTVYFTLAS